MFTLLATSLRDRLNRRLPLRLRYGEVRKNEARQRAALDAAGAGWWNWNVRAGTITWSDVCRRLYGFDPGRASLSFAEWLGLVHSEDREPTDRLLYAVADGTAADMRVDFRIRHPDSGERWIQVLGRAERDKHGKILGVAAIHQDVTASHRATQAAQEQAEQRMAAARAEAERADRVKAQFLASASHDIRQPIQSLMFFHSALAARLKGHPAMVLVDNMQDGLNALMSVLDGLLDISKLDAGLIETRTSIFPLGALLQRLEADYADAAEAKGLELHMVPTEAWVKSDMALLERILRHLLDNAVKYTDHGKILLGCRHRGNAIRVDVVDTGLGIPAHRQEDVFDEFVQLGNPERDRRNGLGLGLAIVRRLCALLDHQVTLRSQLGHGTAVSVMVPAAKPRGVAKRRRVARRSPGGVALVVDDEALVLVGLRSMLEGLGWEVLAADSGEQAVRLVSGRRAPDVIVADYRLRGEETGLGVIRDVDRACGVHVPALVLTGDVSVQQESAGYRTMLKPITPYELEEVLAELRA